VGFPECHTKQIVNLCWIRNRTAGFYSEYDKAEGPEVSFRQVRKQPLLSFLQICLGPERWKLQGTVYNCSSEKLGHLVRGGILKNDSLSLRLYPLDARTNQQPRLGVSG
jgi:hypothetical protein